MAAFGSVLFSSTIRKNAPAGMTERKAKADLSASHEGSPSHAPVEMTGLPVDERQL
jgi:hypothetical protein